MVGTISHKSTKIVIIKIMGKVRDWENYLDDDHEENVHQKIRKFKDNEDRSSKKRRKA